MQNPLLLIIITCFLTAVSPTRAAGLLPANFDGFETGDWRNFLAKYVGDATDWRRHRFDIIDHNPIAGRHALRWTAGEHRHQWLLVSNAFYLAQPVTISVDVRFDGGDNDALSAGLLILETYEKFSGIRIDTSNASLLNDTADFDGTDRAPADIEPDIVYTLTVSIDAAGHLQTQLLRTADQHVIATFDGETSVNPEGLALYIDSPANSDSAIVFDNVRVHAAPYRVRAGEWTRAPIPYFVALPQQGDVEQDEGNWVGGHSIFTRPDGHHMWYRIRDNQQRGAGYGYAHSEDGLTWRKHDKHPLFQPDKAVYASNEKITVLQVDGLYHTWYTAEQRDHGWIMRHAVSRDGLSWTDHQTVIDDLPCSKDGDVVYVDGTYYLYLIGPQYTDFSVYTSHNGVDWQRRHTIPLGIHRHPSAYYDPATKRFWLYAFGGRQGVHRASSEDGVHFGRFEYVWSEAPVGIDDWREGGIDYGQFFRDPHGHILDGRNLMMIYQGRNNYANNFPGWNYHGSERLLLAGSFVDLYLNVPTRVYGDQPHEYERYPFGATAIEGLKVTTSSQGRIVVSRWTPGQSVVLQGTLQATRGTRWRIEVSNAMTPGEDHELVIAGNVAETWDAGRQGDGVFTACAPSDTTVPFILRKAAR